MKTLNELFGIEGDMSVLDDTIPEDAEYTVGAWKQGSGIYNSFYGKKHIGAALENVRTAFKGRKHTEETKQKLRMVDKSYTQTEEYKQKQRESHIGQVAWNKGKTGIYSEETLKKMGDAKRGKTYSPEARKKMSESAKGRVWTEEHKKNQAEAVRKYYENKRNIKC
jgi:hypothetical protein